MILSVGPCCANSFPMPPLSKRTTRLGAASNSEEKRRDDVEIGQAAARDALSGAF